MNTSKLMLGDQGIYRLLVEEERFSQQIRSTRMPHWCPEWGYAFLAERVNEYLVRFITTVRPIYLDKEKDPALYQATLNQFAGEYLQSRMLRSEWLQASHSPAIDAQIHAIRANDQPERVIDFLWPMIMPPNDQYHEERKQTARRILESLLADLSGYDESIRVRKQRCSRRLASRLNSFYAIRDGRRLLGHLNLLLVLAPNGTNKSDAYALSHFRNAFLKDWKKKGLFEGSLDVSWTLNWGWYLGAFLSVDILVDVNLVGDIGLMGQRLGEYWGGEVTRGQGMAFSNAMLPNPDAMIDVANHVSVKQYLEKVHFACEREMCLRIRNFGSQETSGHMTVGSSHWSSRASLRSASINATPLHNHWLDKSYLSAEVEQGADPDAVINIPMGFDYASGKMVSHRLGALANNHLLLLGPSGSGKTKTLINYGKCLLRENVPFILLDSHHEGERLDIKTCVVSNGTKDVYGINPLIPSFPPVSG